MRMYSDEQLDAMAEAYTKALELVPGAGLNTEVARQLVHEIGAAVTSGILDCDQLALAALRRSQICLGA